MSGFFTMVCRDEAGRITFSTDIRTIRAMTMVSIPAGGSGSIQLSALPSGLEGVMFLPQDTHIDEERGYSDELEVLYGRGGYAGDLPYTWVEGGALHWRGGTMAVYMMVVDEVGLGGSGQMDGPSP